MNNQKLVPNRECGECTVCCVELTIECPELTKLSGVSCHNLNPEGGCAIYNNRPKTCQDWYCMWRMLPQLNEDWRPDKKGIMIKNAITDVPIEYADKIALEFDIIHDIELSEDPEIVGFLAAFIEQGYACFLSIGKTGYSSTISLLNEFLLPAVLAKDLQKFKTDLSIAQQKCRDRPKNKMEIKDGNVIILKDGS